MMENDNICKHCHEANGECTYCFYYLDRYDGQKIYAQYCGDCGRDLREKRVSKNV